MNSKLLMPCMLAAGFIPAMAQNLALLEPSPLQKQFQIVERATRDWAAADRNLENDIFAMPEAKARQRIQRAVTTHDRYARERESYLGLWISELWRHARSLEDLNGEAATEAFRASSQERARSLTKSQRDLLAEFQKARGEANPNDLLEAEEVEKQQTAAERLQEKLQRQVDVLDSLDGSAVRAREARRNMLQTVQSAIRYFEAERALAANEARVQQKYYQQLSQMISRADRTATKKKDRKEK